MTRQAPIYRQTTEAEVKWIHKLNTRVTFPVASYDKRFARSIDPTRITDKQAAYLRVIVHRYRRQTGGCLNREACEKCRHQKVLGPPREKSTEGVVDPVDDVYSGFVKPLGIGIGT